MIDIEKIFSIDDFLEILKSSDVSPFKTYSNYDSNVIECSLCGSEIDYSLLLNNKDIISVISPELDRLNPLLKEFFLKNKKNITIGYLYEIYISESYENYSKVISTKEMVGCSFVFSKLFKHKDTCRLEEVERRARLHIKLQATYLAIKYPNIFIENYSKIYPDLINISIFNLAKNKNI